jgi:hypothetical protein
VQLGISTGINRFVVVVEDPDPIPDIGPDLDPARIKGIVQKTELIFKVMRVSLFYKFFMFFGTLLIFQS